MEYDTSSGKDFPSTNTCRAASFSRLPWQDKHVRDKVSSEVPSITSTPNPSHTGQAPAGLLKEKRRGSSSLKLYPHCGHASCDENKISENASSMETTRLKPSPKRNAFSNESLKRTTMSFRTLSRSTTTSIVC